MTAARPGVAYLVGAGPGDPGLMTVRALELIAGADVILYDRLIPDEALASARTDAELVYVGKEPGKPGISQAEIERLLVDHASAGRSVVRLKGGDPFVFGRGGEEAEALVAAGIDFEVVPGVTAGVAAPAFAGIPVTHREDASAVAFVSGFLGRERGETDGIDWPALARFPGTLVFYMGLGSLPKIAAELVAHGRDPSQPAVAIERGTLPRQRVVEASLGELPRAVANAGLQAPAILLFGPVAARRGSIAWLENRPLHGRRVVVTRARAQASGLVTTLRELGATVIELPTIRIVPTTDAAAVVEAVAAIDTYELICLTSANAVRLLIETMAAAGRDVRALAGAKLAVIGPTTAMALREHGLIADIVAERFVAEGLIEALSGLDLKGRRVLLAHGAAGRPVLPEVLRRRGADLDEIVLYKTVAEQPDPTLIAMARGAEFLTFASSSSVRNFLEVIDGPVAEFSRVVSIGPATSATLREVGMRVDAEADPHDVDGLVTALLREAARPE